MSIDDIDREIRSYLPALASLGGTVKLDLGEEGVLFLDATGETPELSREDREADCVLRVSPENMRKLIEGRLNPLLALTLRKIKVEGDTSLARRLATLIQEQRQAASEDGGGEDGEEGQGPEGEGQTPEEEGPRPEEDGQRPEHDAEQASADDESGTARAEREPPADGEPAHGRPEPEGGGERSARSATSAAAEEKGPVRLPHDRQRARGGVEGDVRRPALVLLGGDFVYSPDSATVREAVGYLRPLAEAGVPTYAVLGNHDYSLMKKESQAREEIARYLEQQLEAAGIRVLQNEAELLSTGAGDSLYLVGVGSEWASNSDVRRALDAVPEGTPRIVLTHNPVAFRDLPPHTAPLTVAGHTHGGQIRIPLTPSESWLDIARPREVIAEGGELRLEDIDQGGAVLSLSEGTGGELVVQGVAKAVVRSL